MISSVSNVSFRGDAAPVNAQDLINSPGKFTTQAPKAEAPADSFEKEGVTEEKKKSKAPAIIGTIVGLLAATYVGLSIAVGKKVLTRASSEKELGFMDNIKNFLVDIGESGEKLWNKIRGKKVDDMDGKPKNDTHEIKKPESEPKPQAEGEAPAEVKPKTDGEAKTEVQPKSEGEAKVEGENKPEAQPKSEGEVKAEGENK